MSQVGQLIFVVLVVALVIFLLWFFIFKCKRLKPNDLYMIDGGVKTGKSLITVMLSVKAYRRALIRYYICNVFIRFINLFRRKGNKKRLLEKPMLYSNMPLYRVKYNYLTLDVIFGKVRIPHKSVVLIDEATLLADSMLGMVTSGFNSRKKTCGYTFEQINENLTLFLKTFGHMTHGGKCFYNSQSVIDLHFSFKRNTSVYCYVMRTRKFPFFCLSEVREVVHDESNDIVNVVTRDAELDNRPLFISKRYYRYYDRYYLDVLTKNLPLYVHYDVEKISWKNHQEIREILTLGNYEKIRDYNLKNKEVQQ